MNWLSGPNPYAGLSAGHSDFPSILPYSEAADWIAASGQSEVVLGVDGTGSPLTADLDADSPHILINAPTNRGKSAVARSVAVQRLIKGDVVIFLDVKRHSHRWAQKLAPNVHYFKEVADIGGALTRIGEEVRRRNVIADNWDGPIGEAPVGQRIIVVFEEQNSTMRALSALGKRLPEGDYSALQGMEDIAFMGRAVKVHLVSVAQLASYRATGGAEIVEQFDLKIMIGYSQQAWRYLASDCGKFMTAPEEHGRGVMCRSGKARKVQLLWVPEGDAAGIVTSAPLAQRTARELNGGRRNLPSVWREAIGR